MPWTIAQQAPLSMGFPRQGYCSRLPFPFQGALPKPRDQTHIPCMGRGFFTAEPAGKPEEGSTTGLDKSKQNAKIT